MRPAIEIAELIRSCSKGFSWARFPMAAPNRGRSMGQEIVLLCQLALLCTGPLATALSPRRLKTSRAIGTTAPVKTAAHLKLTSRFIASPQICKTLIEQPGEFRFTFQIIDRCCNQKLKVICKSMLRFAAGEEKNPPASALDLSKSGDSRTPTGCARFTLLKTLRVIAAKVKE